MQWSLAPCFMVVMLVIAAGLVLVTWSITAGRLVDEKWVGWLFRITTPLGRIFSVKCFAMGLYFNSPGGIFGSSRRREEWRLESDSVIVSLPSSMDFAHISVIFLYLSAWFWIRYESFFICSSSCWMPHWR